MPKQQPKQKEESGVFSMSNNIWRKQYKPKENKVLTAFQPSQDWKMLAGLQLHHFDGQS